MKKALICIGIALVMTLPVAIGIGRIPGSIEWTATEQGHMFFDPLYKAFDAYDCETSSDVVFGAFLLFGFVISLVLTVAGWMAVSRLRHTNRH